jgi:glutamate-1-semialdehyde 2,1-aminomutase/spore coat polysaccharide biosynthesis protein SpsF
MGSSRLPGKVMQNLAGKPVLAHVLERCAAIPGKDVVVCAVPDEPASAPLEAVARQCGAEVCRGSETDVLARHLAAARMVGAEIVMRVTSDCPLIDPGICGAVLAQRARETPDYVANNMPRSFPHGLDCEAFTTIALAEADSSTRDAYDREHVTPWLRRAPHLRRANHASGDPSLGRHRWTLDFPEDLDFFRAVFAALPAGSRGLMPDVLSVIAAQPAIGEINARHGSRLTGFE